MNKPDKQLTADCDEMQHFYFSERFKDVSMLKDVVRVKKKLKLRLYLKGS